MVELPVDSHPPQRPSSPNEMGFLVTNRNKRSMTLDVRTRQGREVLLDLVKVSDVVVENFRPGMLASGAAGMSQDRSCDVCYRKPSTILQR